MNILTVISLVLSVCASARQTTPSWAYNPSTSAPDDDYCTSEYSCVNCTTVRLCAPTSTGQLKAITEFTCPTSTPWCDPDTATCIDTEPLTCGNSTTSFICMRDGVYPDVTNCSRYYQCEDDVAVMYRCEGDKPYYASYLQECVSAAHVKYCASYNTSCGGKSGVKLPVASSGDNMFVYCVDGEVLTVDRCIGGYRYDNLTQNCQAACPHDGLFPDDSDCTKYYRCSPSAADADDDYDITTDLSCPDGEAFSELEYQCVEKNLVANCNVTSGAFNAIRKTLW